MSDNQRNKSNKRRSQAQQAVLDVHTHRLKRDVNSMLSYWVSDQKRMGIVLTPADIHAMRVSIREDLEDELLYNPSDMDRELMQIVQDEIDEEKEEEEEARMMEALLQAHIRELEDEKAEYDATLGGEYINLGVGRRRGDRRILHQNTHAPNVLPEGHYYTGEWGFDMGNVQIDRGAASGPPRYSREPTLFRRTASVDIHGPGTRPYIPQDTPAHRRGIHPHGYQPKPSGAYDPATYRM
jgi:hypothetical protein